MAATTGTVWSKPGAWALDAEEYEAEVQQQKPISDEKLADFPSLSAASTTKTKKKKAQTLSLAAFAAQEAFHPKGPTHEDLINLPTGPRERTAEELDRSRLGGGFRSYGGNSRYNSNSSGDEARWGSGRDSDDNRRQGGFSRDASRELAPSRADEIDDWSSTKKSMPVNASGFERRERGGFFGSQSKADESGSWFSNKSEPRRSATNDSGFERRGSFDTLSRDRGDRNASIGGGSDDWGRKREESNGSGERPRLVLQPRTLPLAVSDVLPAPVVPAVTMVPAVVPGVTMVPAVEVTAKAKGVSPFGQARPREEVLAEKGKDWKEIDEKLENLKASYKETVVPRRDASMGKGFGSGSSFTEARIEKSWRKNDSIDSHSRPQSRGDQSMVPDNTWRKSNPVDSGSRPQSAETMNDGSVEGNEN